MPDWLYKMYQLESLIYVVVTIIVKIVPGAFLLYYLKKFYNYEYQKQKVAIISFLVLENFFDIFVILPDNFLTYYNLINGNKKSEYQYFVNRMWAAYSRTGIPVTSLAIGLLFIKKSRDPIAGV